MNKHNCERKDLEWENGAKWNCFEHDDDGILQLTIAEYEIEVMFCPFCGYSPKEKLRCE